MENGNQKLDYGSEKRHTANLTTITLSQRGSVYWNAQQTNFRKICTNNFKILANMSANIENVPKISFSAKFRKIDRVDTKAKNRMRQLEKILPIRIPPAVIRIHSYQK